MGETTMNFGIAGLVATLAIAMGTGVAVAQDKLKIGAGQRGNYDTAVSDVGQRLGIFKKYGLDVEVLWTQGSGETQQAIISNSVDVGISLGTQSVFGAYAKGAPIRIIGAEMTGAADLFWYVKADSPIKSLKDAEGKSIAFSTVGASTHSVVLQMIRTQAPKARAVATGSPPSTLTQVMSGQVDIGWAAPPIGLEQLEKNEIRIVASGNDTTFKTQTVRVIGVNPATLLAKKNQLERYMKGYRETIDAMWVDQGLKEFASWLGVPEERARKARDGFFPKEGVNPDTIHGVNELMNEAIGAKFLAAPLTEVQLKELIQIIPR
jgi:NitT/TauT family transport system substrate-binding protein